MKRWHREASEGPGVGPGKPGARGCNVTAWPATLSSLCGSACPLPCLTADLSQEPNMAARQSHTPSSRFQGENLMAPAWVNCPQPLSSAVGWGQFVGAWQPVGFRERTMWLRITPFDIYHLYLSQEVVYYSRLIISENVTVISFQISRYFLSVFSVIHLSSPNTGSIK